MFFFFLFVFINMITIKDGEAVLSDYMLALPSFKKLYQSDKDKKKTYFHACLLYIYFMYDFSSPYFDYPETKRHEQVKEYVLPNTEIKTDDPVLLECIAVYKSFKPIEIQLLEDGLTACYNLGEYIRSVDYKETDDNGKRKHNPKEIADIVNNLGKTITSIKQLRAKAKEGLNDATKVEKELFEDE